MEALGVSCIQPNDLVVKIMSLTRLKGESLSATSDVEMCATGPRTISLRGSCLFGEGRSREVTRERHAKGETISCYAYLLHTFFSFDLK